MRKGAGLSKNLSKAELVGRVMLSVLNAEKLASGLPPEIIQLEGMSSPKVRHFLNSVCSFEDTRYLEVGTAAGSTHVSAMFGNSPEVAVGMDLWLEQKNEGGKEAFLENCEKCLGQKPTEEPSDWYLMSGDCFQADLSKMPHDINVYFYDGGHEVEDHFQALKYFEPILADRFIMIIDDWNDHRVQLGTRLAIKEGMYDVVFSHYGQANPGSTPGVFGDMAEWWNGILFLVLEKK